MTDQKIAELKEELIALLEKYDVSIGFECADCSDLCGVRDEMIIVQENKTEKNILEADGYWLMKNNIE